MASDASHASPPAPPHPSTLLDKVWDAHVVRELEDGRTLLYIDRHIAHEVTTPQAFEGLELAGRKLWRPAATKAVSDHNVPTKDVTHITDPVDMPYKHLRKVFLAFLRFFLRGFERFLVK